MFHNTSLRIKNYVLLKSCSLNMRNIVFLLRAPCNPTSGIPKTTIKRCHYSTATQHKTTITTKRYFSKFNYIPI